MASVNGTSNYDPYLNETNTANAKRAIQGKGADQLTMDDFFTLLTAQMTNQDMLNPQDNTEFVAQMAQFTTLQGMKQIQEYQLSSYAISYVGKDVTIAQINEYTGDMETIKGKVESITFYDGTPQVVVGSKTYPLYTIMEVNASASSGSSDSGSGTTSELLNQASQYIGKTVNILHENDEGYPEIITGEVTHATLVDGEPHVVIDYKEYPVSEIQGVVDSVWLKAQEEANKYVGETVKIVQTGEDGGTLEFTGEVTGAKVIGGKPYVTIDGADFPVSDIR